MRVILQCDGLAFRGAVQENIAADAELTQTRLVPCPHWLSGGAERTGESLLGRTAGSYRSPSWSILTTVDVPSHARHGGTTASMSRRDTRCTPYNRFHVVRDTRRPLCRLARWFSPGAQTPI